MYDYAAVSLHHHCLRHIDCRRKADRGLKRVDQSTQMVIVVLVFRKAECGPGSLVAIQSGGNDFFCLSARLLKIRRSVRVFQKGTVRRISGDHAPAPHPFMDVLGPWPKIPIKLPANYGPICSLCFLYHNFGQVSRIRCCRPMKTDIIPSLFVVNRRLSRMDLSHQILNAHLLQGASSPAGSPEISDHGL